MKWTKQLIEKLISDGIEESATLEYKSALLLNDTRAAEKLSICVSAMANAVGGTIILGVAENPIAKHKIGTITPISRLDWSKEKLENVIISNISPRIAIAIQPIEFDDGLVYVIEILQSNTAHQAKDFKYYKRLNFQAQPMQDYEIRDVMNRMKFPDVELKFQIRRVNWSGDRSLIALVVSLENIGTVLARYCNYVLYFFDGFIKKGYEELYISKKAGYNDVLVFGENSKRDDMSIQLDWGGSVPDNPIAGPMRYIPLLPGREIEFGSYIIDDGVFQFGLQDFQLKWEVYADNAPRKFGEISFKTIVDKSNANS